MICVVSGVRLLSRGAANGRCVLAEVKSQFSDIFPLLAPLKTREKCRHRQCHAGR